MLLLDVIAQQLRYALQLLDDDVLEELLDVADVTPWVAPWDVSEQRDVISDIDFAGQLFPQVPPLVRYKTS